VPVLFASTEGQTALIAIRLAQVLHEHGFVSQAIDVSTPEAAALDWSGVRGVLVGASLHMGRHQKSADRFVREHAKQLNAVPSAFFSVSLSAASKNRHEVEAAEGIAKAFPANREWTPTFVASFAGRLAYMEYNVFIRFVIKQIAKKEGGPTDTSRDHELTNWEEVELLGHKMAGTIRARVAA
jgi:menaquinone-dependent protoporphyrinogen oxidase